MPNTDYTKHRMPPYVGCGTLPTYFECNNHWRNDETQIYRITADANGALDVYGQKYKLVEVDNIPQTKSIATCQKFGWKRVIAGKVHHGAQGFQCEDGCNSEQWVSQDPSSSYMSLAEWEPERMSPTCTTRYKSATINADFSVTNVDKTLNITYWANAQVNGNTGIVTFSGSGFQFSGDTAYFNTASMQSKFQNQLNIAAAFHCPSEAAKQYHGYQGTEYYIAYDGGNLFNFTVTGPDTYPHGYDDEEYIDGSWASLTLSDIWFAWSTVRNMYGDQSYEFSINIDLADPTTETDLKNSVKGYLDYWADALYDDVSYPLRVDNLFQICPFVHCDEKMECVDPRNHLFHEVGWTDPDTGKYSGNVIGKPFPKTMAVTGSNGFMGNVVVMPESSYWQEKHQNYTYDAGLGQWDRNTSTPTGSNTNNIYWATDIGPDPVAYLESGTPVDINSPIAHKGAFSIFNLRTFSYYEAVWLEVLPGLIPSMNWARPCSSSVYYDQIVTDSDTQDCTFGGDILDVVYGESGSIYYTTCSYAGLGMGYNNPCGNKRFLNATSSCAGFWNDEGRKFEYVLNTYNYDYRYTSQRDRMEDLISTSCIGGDLWPDIQEWCSTLTASADLYSVTETWTGVSSTQQYYQFNPCMPNAVVIATTNHTNSYVGRYNVAFHPLLQAGIDFLYGTKAVQVPFDRMTDLLWKMPSSICNTAYQLQQMTCDSGAFVWSEDVGRAHGICDNYTATPDPGGHFGAEDYVLENTLGQCVYGFGIYPHRPYVEARTSPPVDSCTGNTASAMPAGTRPCINCGGYVTALNGGGAIANDTASSNWTYNHLCNQPAIWRCYESGTPEAGHMYSWVIDREKMRVVANDFRFADVYMAHADYGEVEIVL